MKTCDDDEDGRQEAQKRGKMGVENRGLQGAAVRCGSGVRCSSETEDRSYKTYSACGAPLAMVQTGRIRRESPATRIFRIPHSAA